ncbi:hypothetical protein NHP190003_04440 [Helicobacter sp. NHP19-003]|uniref:DUF5675 domain-containing protein n=1 Tax=Helicobacter gastrocanis TaxID=2849641 RepID=A0ABM7S9C1_9HELI|nr:DUF5675 family protein [Helicobacter sp. NHP19-003]BCZ17162.1 hypothetical protein NHP190003_04440 [Helicobacter sp. NHP19-003]
MFKVTITRKQTTPAVSKKGKSEQGTLGELVVYDAEGQEVYRCHTMENDGEPTHESGKDKPIMPGTYTLHFDYTSVCVPPQWRNKNPWDKPIGLWLKDPNNPAFAKRRITIHVGNDAIDTLGCILLGKSYNDKLGIIQHSTQAVDEFYDLVETVLTNL